MYKILIVDNNILFREGLTNLLRQEPGISVVGEAGTIAEAMVKVHTHLPDLALVDADLPDLDDSGRTGPVTQNNSGKDLHYKNGLRALCMLYPQMQVVFISTVASEDLLMYAVRNGARGYLPKNHSMSRFMASIRALERGEAVIPRSMVGRLLEEFSRITNPDEQDGLSILTRRETDVLAELSRGRSNRQIAENLSIAENTVKVHVHNILEKLNLHNRRQAARYARIQGVAPAKGAKGYSPPERARVFTNRIDKNETLTSMTDNVNAMFKSTSKPR